MLWFAGVHFESSAFQMSAFPGLNAKYQSRLRACGNAVQVFRVFAGILADVWRYWCSRISLSRIRKEQTEERLAGKARSEV